MKIRIGFPVWIVLLMIACSTDGIVDQVSDEAVMEPEDSKEISFLVGGTWVLNDLVLDESVGDSGLKLAEAVVDDLVQEDCYLLTFTFTVDGKVVATDKLTYIELVGLAVPCPEKSDELEYQWEVEGDQLTLTDKDGTQETITIQYDEDNDTLTLSGADLSQDYKGANVVFGREDD